jgi:hypothetical protein
MELACVTPAGKGRKKGLLGLGVGPTMKQNELLEPKAAGTLQTGA